MNVRSYKYPQIHVAASENIIYLSRFLKLLADESRLRILYSLRENLFCVCELSERLGLSQSLISHHLKDLKSINLVSYEKRGLRVYYSLTNAGRDITNLLFSILKIKAAAATSSGEPKEGVDK